MIAVAIIVFREVLEASLIVSIVLAASKGTRGRAQWVFGGVALGVLGACVVAGFAAEIAAAVAGMGQELFNATILFAAVGMLGWHNVWMGRHGKEMALEASALGREVAAGARPLYALASVVGIAVLREGSETVLFLYGLAAAGSGGAVNLIGGGAIGILGGALMGAALYLGLLRVPSRHLFAVTSWMIVLLAAGLASQAAFFLNQADVLPALGNQIWDTSWLLDEDSVAGRVLHVLIGYVARPEGIQLVFWIATVGLLLVLMRWFSTAPPRAATRAVAILALALAGIGLAHAARAAERTHYIAADELVWNYAPSYPENPLSGQPFTKEESAYLRSAKDRIGRKYLKALYREYTDASFETLKERSPDEEHLGILGPIIHAEVGDTITVVFRNNTRLPVGIHPHGLFYEKTSEGAHYMTASAGTAGHAHGRAPMPETGGDVRPGGEYVYHWTVPERAGPGPSDLSSVAWLYHAHDHESVDIYAGLVGAIIVTRAGQARPDGRPNDVDREFVTLLMIFDENASPYLDANIRRFVSARVGKKDADFIEANKKHAVNGLLYGNLGGLTMRRGERVRWYVIGLGNEADIHTAHWHGNTVLRGGARIDTVHVFPATTEVVDMEPDNSGVWLLHCHVADHMTGGMMTRYTVTD